MAVLKPLYNLKKFIVQAAVDTSLTTIVTGDCFMEEFSVANTTGGALTFLLEDLTGKSGSPLVLVPTMSITANSLLTGDFHNLIINGDGIPGRYMAGGIKWQAGGAGLDGYIYYWQ